MKTLRISTLVLLALALLLSLSAMAAAAQEPVANLYPSGALYIDNQVHNIPASTSLWYHFDYALSSSLKPQMTTLKLLYGDVSNVGFDIFEPQDMNAYTQSGLKPIIGKGMPNGDDLVWTGALGATGTYYVRVTNYNTYATTFLLTISGKGVSVTAPIAVTGVSATATTTANMDDPNKAVLLDGKSQTVPANSAIWYRFDYSAGDINTIRLQYGVKSGLSFEVYTPEILNKWWTNDPIGVGRPEMQVCSTRWCQGNDLVWVGAFGMDGTYYVRVINGTGNDMPAELTIK